MNGTPHIHKVQIKIACLFPHLTSQWYVVYGDQKVWLGAETWFRRSLNPYKWTPEERERRLRAAIDRVIAKHDAGSKRAGIGEAIAIRALELQPHPERAPLFWETLVVQTWPSEEVMIDGKHGK